LPQAGVWDNRGNRTRRTLADPEKRGGLPGIAREGSSAKGGERRQGTSYFEGARRRVKGKKTIFKI